MNDNYEKLWEGFKKKYWDDTITIYIKGSCKNYITKTVKDFMNEYEGKHIILNGEYK